MPKARARSNIRGRTRGAHVYRGAPETVPVQNDNRGRVAPRAAEIRERVFLHLTNVGPATKAELAELVGLVPASLTQYLTCMTAEGLIISDRTRYFAVEA